MKEDILNTLRQQDAALRKALRQEEAELPKMPADLNARLMQRVKQEPRKATVRRLWPWVAAACVAGFMAVFLMPPKDVVSPQDKGAVVADKVEQKAVQQPKAIEPVQPQMAEMQTATESPRKVKRVKPATIAKPQLLAQESIPAEPMATEATMEDAPQKELAQTDAKTVTEANAKAVTLTERDIPITRPENYKYTPEELALLRKQADEAYLKWVELELEISKNNLQQTVQK